MSWVHSLLNNKHLVSCHPGSVQIGSFFQGKLERYEKAELFCFSANLPSIRTCNRPFSYSKKEPGSSVIFIHFMRSVRSSGVKASITIVHIQ